MSEITTSVPRRSGRVRCAKLSTHIDMTPMVDLAFLLLTFFILTTVLMKATVIETVVPEKAIDTPQPAVPAKRVLSFYLAGDNKLLWQIGNGELTAIPFHHQEVNKLLSTQNSKIENMIVMIKATSDSRYQNMVDILDELGIADIKRYYLIDATADEYHQVKLTLTSNHQINTSNNQK